MNNRQRDIIRVLFSILISTVILEGCGKDKSPVAPETDVSDIVAQGWQLFQQSPPDYAAALEQFSMAVSLNPNSAEAYTGRGWSYARLAFGTNDIRYVLADGSFSLALERSNDQWDAWAGLAFVKLVLNDYEEAISNADSVLQAKPDYIFEHDPEVTAADLRLAMAQSYFFLGQFAEVAALLDILQPGVIHPADQPDVLLVQIQNLWSVIL